jgi:NAD(P)-dependent dehydrogenase (short-subunit alcohol dehydrogenase family)
MGWKKNLEAVNALVSTESFEAGKTWCEEHPADANGYLFSKQCIIVYTMTRAGQLAERGVRVNCLSPAPTDTPMMKAFTDQVPKEFMDEHFQSPVGRNATSEEMAEPLVFLGSRAARFVSGVNLFVDHGYLAQVETGQRVGLL